MVPEKILERLKNNREKYVEKIPVYEIASRLGKLSALWLRKDFSFRKRAVEKLLRRSFFTRQMSEALLDGLFRELTASGLLRLLKSELKDPLVLDGFRRDALTGHEHRARGPELITHVFSGNVPNPAIISFNFGMLIKSANVGKCSSEDEGFLDIYLDSLNDFDRKLGSSNFLVDPGDKKPLAAFIRSADLVVAYGSNETLSEIRKEAPVGVDFIGYGHRLSFAFYAKEALQKKRLRELARRAARDIWMMDQRGCLSPLVIYVEEGGKIPAGDFSLSLSEALQKLDFHDERLFQLKNRLKISRIRGGLVKSVKNAGSFLKILESNRRFLQCVALEAPAEEREKIAGRLSALGVNRLCRAGRMQFPPITWRHDGKANLANWLTWTDLES